LLRPRPATIHALRRSFAMLAPFPANSDSFSDKSRRLFCRAISRLPPANSCAAASQVTAKITAIFAADNASQEVFFLQRQGVDAKCALAGQRWEQGKGTETCARTFPPTAKPVTRTPAPSSFGSPVAKKRGKSSGTRTAPGAAIRHTENHRPFDQTGQGASHVNPYTECLTYRVHLGCHSRTTGCVKTRMHQLIQQHPNSRRLFHESSLRPNNQLRYSVASGANFREFSHSLFRGNDIFYVHAAPRFPTSRRAE